MPRNRTSVHSVPTAKPQRVPPVRPPRTWTEPQLHVSHCAAAQGCPKRFLRRREQARRRSKPRGCTPQRGRSRDRRRLRVKVCLPEQCAGARHDQVSWAHIVTELLPVTPTTRAITYSVPRRHTTQITLSSTPSQTGKECQLPNGNLSTQTQETQSP